MKRQKSTKTKKLTLSKESLRMLTLTRRQLTGVEGGAGTRSDFSISHGTIFTSK